MDLSHLDALIARLGRESQRAADATTDHERRFRRAQVNQCQREIRGEKAFLRLPDLDGATDSEVLALLGYSVA